MKTGDPVWDAVCDEALGKVEVCVGWLSANTRGPLVAFIMACGTVGAIGRDIMHLSDEQILDVVKRALQSAPAKGPAQ